MRVSLIVPQIEFRLLAYLEKKFANDPDIVIIRDRRSGQPRRRRPSMRNQERRKADRRSRSRESVGTFFLMRDDAAP